jgi:hypothetical protein
MDAKTQLVFLPFSLVFILHMEKPAPQAEPSSRPLPRDINVYDNANLWLMMLQLECACPIFALVPLPVFQSY